jgi:uncharacterized membrane protein
MRRTANFTKGIFWIVTLGTLALFSFSSVVAKQSPKLQIIDVPGGSRTQPFGISDNGDIVGYYVAGDGLWKGFLLRDGKFLTIEFPYAVETQVLRVTSTGVITGCYWPTGWAGGERYAFYLDDEGFHTLEFPGEDFSAANGINSRGEIVGPNKNAAEGIYEGYLWRDGEVSFFRVPGGTTLTDAIGINARGDIVGYFGAEAPVEFKGFLLSKGKFSKYQVPGAIRTYFFDINDRGQITGHYRELSGRYVGLVLLNEEFVTVDLGLQTKIYGLNNRGDLIGVFWDDSNVRHGFFLPKGANFPIE